MGRKFFSAIFILTGIISMLVFLTGWGERKRLVSGAEIQASVTKSLALLQKSNYLFTIRNSRHCASCHHTTLTSMAVALGVRKGIAATDSFSVQRVFSMENTIRYAWNENLVGSYITDPISCWG
jgi:hypothetical protein